MSPRFRYEMPDGGIVICDTATDLAAVIRELRETSRATNGSKGPRPAPIRAAPKGLRATNDRPPDRTLELLRELDRAGANGVPIQRLMEMVEVTAGKALGPYAGMINRRLKEVGFSDPREVYSAKRSRHGRVWIRRRKIGRAIALLEQLPHGNGDRQEGHFTVTAI